MTAPSLGVTYAEYLAKFGLPDHPNVKRDWAIQFGTAADKAPYQAAATVDPVALDSGGGAAFGAGGSPTAAMPVKVSEAQHVRNQGSNLDIMRRDAVQRAEVNYAAGVPRAYQDVQQKAGGAIDQRTGVVTPFAEVRNSDGSLVNPKAAAAAAAAPATTTAQSATPGTIARGALTSSDVTNREAATLAELQALRQRVESQDVDARMLADQGLAQQIAAARSTGGTAAQRASAGFAASQAQPLIAAQAAETAGRVNAANSGLLTDLANSGASARDASVTGQARVDELGMKRDLGNSAIGLQQAQTDLTKEQAADLRRQYDLAMKRYLDAKDEKQRAEAYGILSTVGTALGLAVGGPAGGAAGAGILPVAAKALGVDKWL